ncbi:glycoside hydrolase family 3 N-terminal domain-containing protein [Candidatus Solirubrobacter pratensis]|uniref:glycoside hydrolase family 3 N-terminal domain-containing protein n=1 Tax=Candidatus Solirubrobacter pratensis TaxID=1298857 RepID=UPI0003F5F73D|nr:glycoside hydrolase family 3 N-terminal domain-containing protein [Candidatus Solirubrobacter pratensis]
MRWQARAAGIAALLSAAAVVVITEPAHAAVPVTLQADQAVYLVDQGGTAHVGIRLTTTGNVATDADVTVSYSTGGTLSIGSGTNLKTLPDTAVPGTDYTAATGTVTFPAGSASGTVKTVDVSTLAVTGAAKAKTITVPFTATSANGSAITNNQSPPSVVINAHGFPYLDASLPISQRVDDLLSRMSLDEKVGQMTQPERPAFSQSGSVTSNAQNQATSNNNANFIAALGIGSILSGGGSVPANGNNPAAWANMIDDFQTRALRTPLQIPLIYGIDSVHGDNNLVGATIFPHNIGIGAAHDPALAEAEGHIAATETRATGPQMAFAPCICVARDDRWGRTYESYSEDPALVTLLETSIDGFQGTTPTAKAANDRVVASTKHFAGDGLATYGAETPNAINTGIDRVSRADFERLALAPYVQAVQQHHTGTIMPSYSSYDFTDDGIGNPLKMSASKEFMTDWLKTQVGFDGFLISDYNALHQIPGGTGSQPNTLQVATSINAGMDMAMEPSAHRTFITNLIADVNAAPGSPTYVPMSRIDDAVKRILTQKFELGLFEHPLTDRTHIGEVGSAAHRASARQAVAESQVLLKNDGVLPLSKSAKIYLAGSGADDLGNQAGGWTVDWQGASGNARIQGATSIRAGLSQVAPGSTVTYSRDASADMSGSDVGVVVVGETPYAEGNGDVSMSGSGTQHMTLPAADGAAVDKVCGAMKCVVLVISGRPLAISDRLGKMNAAVASWLPGSEGAGVADVLFGDKPFTGRLPMTWPKALTQEPINVGDASYDPQYPFGWGLRTDAPAARASAAAAALPAGPAKDALTALAALPTWDERDVLLRLTGIARQLDQTGADTWTVDDLVVSIARDYAQQAAITPASAKLTSDAEHELLVGNVANAVSKLATTAGFALTETPGGVSGTVPATLALTLAGPASFGVFTPGVANTYTAATTANVISTAGDATLTVSDPGHLANGSFSLPEALQVTLAPASWTAPVSNAAVAIGFSQHIGANDALRTGSYSKTLTFTLSTTSP